jgi:hypothetical protein
MVKIQLPDLSSTATRSRRAHTAWRWWQRSWIWLGVAVTPASFVLAQSPASIESPVAFVGHGAAFDSNGNELPIAPAMVLQVQASILTQLIGASPDNAQYVDALREWRATAPSSVDEAYANAAIITKLLDELKPRDLSYLATTNAFLLRRVTQDSAQGSPSADLDDQLRARGLAPDTVRMSTTSSGQDYIDECAAQRVPIPPAWGDPGWTLRGPLTTKLILPALEADVWTYESTSPRGICIALPRYWPGASVSEAFGIICQGNDSSKACYWDADGVPLSGGSVPLTNWRGGSDLVGGNGVCTDCHAGGNAFIIHPGTALAVSNVSPSNWMDPIVDTSWVKNPGPSTLLDGVVFPQPFDSSCVGCHSAGGGKGFPEVSTALRGYCQVVLQKAYALGGTMPPASPGDWTYFLSVARLKTACGEPPPQDPPPHDNPVACKVFDDGYSNVVGPSEAIFFNGESSACVPDGSTGTCRKWFGQCASTLDNTPVYFEVFNDGGASRTLPFDAVYNRAQSSACIPDNTSTGTCRKWFGIGRTSDDRAVECYLFDDGLRNWVGPTTAIYYRAPNQVCMPDGTATGTCRKWFGNCQISAQSAPPRVTPPTPPPQPSEARRECLEACAAERDACMAEVGDPGAPPPSVCVAGLRGCRAACPRP